MNNPNPDWLHTPPWCAVLYFLPEEQVIKLFYKCTSVQELLEIHKWIQRLRKLLT